MKRLLALVLFLLPHTLAAAPKDPLPKTLTGKVMLIADGDTITIPVGRAQHRIRFDSIDCPERGQPFGTRAREFTGLHLGGWVIRKKGGRIQTDTACKPESELTGVP